MTITADKLRVDEMDGEGRSEAEETRSYNVSVRLVSDANGSDTITEARAYLKANSNMPWYGRSWSLGSSRDPLATCRSVRVRRSHTTFDVTATYTTDTEKNEEKPDDKGNPSTDPLEWRTEMDISYSQTAMAIESATFRGFSRPAGNPWLVPGRVGPIVNSALQPLDVQHLKEVDIQLIRCTFNVKDWDQDRAQQYIGAVNNAPFLVLIPALNFRANFAARTCKVRQYGGRSMYTNRKAYWAVTLEMMVKLDGWRLNVLDSGFGNRMAPGDPKVGDPDNEVWTSVELPDFGNIPIEQAVDENGNPMAVAGLLDGNGKLLKAGQQPVYLEYQIYRETSFAGLFALAS